MLDSETPQFGVIHRQNFWMIDPRIQGDTLPDFGVTDRPNSGRICARTWDDKPYAHPRTHARTLALAASRFLSTANHMQGCSLSSVHGDGVLNTPAYGLLLTMPANRGDFIRNIQSISTRRLGRYHPLNARDWTG